MIISRLAGLSLLAHPLLAHAMTGAGHVRPSPASYIDARHSAPPRELVAALARSTMRLVPSFSRQTGLACAACHYQFPQLNGFGRLFKLNGYTLTGLTTIAGMDSASKASLKLSPIPPVAAMVVTSITHTSVALPKSQNSSALFPEQASIFFAGQVTPSVGTFVQLTYAAQDGAIGVDNIDVRYAKHTSLAEKDLLLGLTMHNNPTSQDVWNTVPAWGYPFMSSSAAPTPAASTLIEGGLAQQVLGLGGYALWNNLVYTEVTAYRSAQQGTHAPLDSASAGVVSGVVPYGRIALQHEAGANYMMVGAFGFAGARLYPGGVTGPTDRYSTLGLDGQLEHKLTGGGVMIGRASFIHEAQRLDASFLEEAAQEPRATVQTFRANVSWMPSLKYSGTLGVFGSSGSTDTLRFAPGAVSGSRTGSPNSSGAMAEFSVNAWQNTRVSLQYTAYQRFNGSSSAYDLVGGRSASANNTLYLYSWIAF